MKIKEFTFYHLGAVGDLKTEQYDITELLCRSKAHKVDLKMEITLNKSYMIIHL